MTINAPKWADRKPNESGMIELTPEEVNQSVWAAKALQGGYIRLRELLGELQDGSRGYEVQGIIDNAEEYCGIVGFELGYYGLNSSLS